MYLVDAIQYIIEQALSIHSSNFETEIENP